MPTERPLTVDFLQEDAPSLIEVQVEGHFQVVTFDLDEFANGISGILPANLSYKLGWDSEVEFLHLYVEPTFLAHIAHESVNPDRVEHGLSPQKLQQAIAYIQEHLGENPSLAAIAHELDMSQYYFCRLFKQSTGTTPHQYLIQQRVERAKQLLRQPELTVTEVAMMCGFAHPSHFTKYFRQQTGVTPSQFRRL